MTFCAKCVRQLCPACLSEEPACKVGPSEVHAFTNLSDVPRCLRNQLDSIQEQLRAEQNALLDAASRSASEMERKEEELHADVDRTVQCMQEALEMLRQMERTISAAAASEIARVLRAGVESNASKQCVEDVQTRALACRQLGSSVAALRNLDDANLAQPINIEFVRHLVRCTQPASTPTPAQRALAPSNAQSAPSTHLPRAKQETPFESQLKNIVQQGKLFIQALESSFQVCTSLFATILFRLLSSCISRKSLPTFIEITNAVEIVEQVGKCVFISR